MNLKTSSCAMRKADLKKSTSVATAMIRLFMSLEARHGKDFLEMSLSTSLFSIESVSAAVKLQKMKDLISEVDVVDDSVLLRLYWSKTGKMKAYHELADAQMQYELLV